MTSSPSCNLALTTSPEWDGSKGAFYVTGYSLQHEPKLGPKGDATPRRTVEEIAAAMGALGGDPRFLALQMLQPNPGWVRDVETTGPSSRC